MQRRDFCKLAATSVAGALALPWNGVSVQAEQPHTELLADPLPAGGSGPLPKVRVHPGWRGLIMGENKPIVPYGATYFRPNTGWAPQVWKQFDAQATARDFAILKANDFNTARIFLASTAFYPKPGALDSQGLEKLDKLIEQAEISGLHLQICGIGGWEGTPAWERTDIYSMRLLMGHLIRRCGHKINTFRHHLLLVMYHQWPHGVYVPLHAKRSITWFKKGWAILGTGARLIVLTRGPRPRG